MRSTSSRRRAIALLLCGTLLWQSAPAVARAEAGPSTEPALLLKYAAPDLPDRSAREVLDPIPAIVARELRIRWLPVPMEPSGKAPSTGDMPVPDDAALRRIAGMVSRASEQMERVESVCTFLGHPPACPHGRPIPRGECCDRIRTEIRPLVMRLTEAALGATVRIVFITPRSKKRLEKLSALGIVPGSRVRLLQRNPSFVLEIGQTTVAVDRDITDEIYVKPT